MVGGFLGTVGEVALLVWHTVAAALRRRPHARVVLDQLHEVGVRSLSIVNLTAIFTGMVMALQLGYFLSRFGAKIFVSKIVGLAVVSELGPVLTALMIGGRVGAGMAAELGTMKVTEQVDALRSLGADPLRYLVAPRLFAITLMLPLLTGMANFVGVVGGMLIAKSELNVEPSFYITSLVQFMTLTDIVRSMIKGVVFAVIIGSIACYNGLSAEGGADGVGRATTRTVVVSSVNVLIADFFLTKLMLLL
jgi:phospholipid/cholesterol/gamma-HCH transport system permease protein